MSAKDRFRVQRENRDKGWRDMLSTSTGREALWELYAQCREGGAVLPRRADGDIAGNAVIAIAAKHTLAHWIENRCMLVDHKNIWRFDVFVDKDWHWTSLLGIGYKGSFFHTI